MKLNEIKKKSTKAAVRRSTDEYKIEFIFSIILYWWDSCGNISGKVTYHIF